MKLRLATEEDIPLLVRFNRRLIEDEGHENRLSSSELKQRMTGWMRGDYTAVMFEHERQTAGYVLYRLDALVVYIRHFYIDRPMRRRGVGRAAMHLLIEEVWPHDTRVLLDVRVINGGGYAFWKALGFREYSVMLELPPHSGD
jgi:GNAT superfamily N-acetyltransferase